MDFHANAHAAKNTGGGTLDEAANNKVTRFILVDGWGESIRNKIYQTK